MKNIKRVLNLTLLVCVLSIYSCAKDGEKGEAGVAGTNGNANVQSVGLIANSWSWNSANSFRYHSFTGVSEITFDIAETGSVLLYQLIGNGAGYIQLPVTVAIGGGVLETDLFVYGDGYEEVQIQNSNMSDPFSQIPTPTYYKLVTISSSARLANPNVDYTNYNEVKQTFNLD